MARSLVVLRGGGDMGSGVAHRLYMAGFDIVILELAQPMAIRRSVSFSSAVYDGETTIEGVTARLAADAGSATHLLEQRVIAVLVDPEARWLASLTPAALVDARLAKRNLDTRIGDAPVVIALGPGFTAGNDVHAVIETQRGHDLGRVIRRGEAVPDTGVPGEISGEGERRVLRAPARGTFVGLRRIGQMVTADEIVAEVAGAPIVSCLDGVLRGILHDGVAVEQGTKVGDIDPRGVVEHCFTISDKARALGGGVLEALLHLGVRP